MQNNNSLLQIQLNQKTNNSIVKKTFGAALLFYLLIVFEFIYMASPFAAYFYSVYKPALNLVDKVPLLSWATGFFLPHLVEETKSPILNSLQPAGILIAVIGMLTFIVCATQVYYAKLFKKGIVTGGLYKFIRHPQYSAFILCSFGLLLIWPRYLALVMFITLLFFYFFLAKIEESECTQKYGSNYVHYVNSTFMFFPLRLPFSQFIVNNNLSLKIKIFSASGIYLAALLLSIQSANLIKKISIDMLYSYKSGKDFYISIYQNTDDKLYKIITLANTNEIIDSLRAKNKESGFINYIVPADMYISEIPMVKPDNASCHIGNAKYSSVEYKVIFTKTLKKRSDGIFSGVFSNTLFLEPLAEVKVTLQENKIQRITLLSRKNERYKNIPEPIF